MVLTLLAGFSSAPPPLAGTHDDMDVDFATRVVEATATALRQR